MFEKLQNREIDVFGDLPQRGSARCRDHNGLRLDAIEHSSVGPADAA
jgi:hypothetical protein